MSAAPFPPFPISGITIPTTPIVLAALEYSRAHTTVATVNHCLRSAAFALILARKDPTYASVDPETIALCTILHDMGWATTKGLLSKDKRFEVDGANIARDFIQAEIARAAADRDESRGKALEAKFDEHRIQLIWDAIALHMTPSIAAHKQKEVALTASGILGDFVGPHHPSGMITVEEFKEVVRAFPRAGYREEIPRNTCAMCVEKPETTYDNAVGELGLKLGVEGYKEKWEHNRMSDMLLGSLEMCEQYEG
ncbi:hypothetical protein BJ138DRAFT_1164156 [Hygrophoropsis aurantiaca]|uniref:Uncharacterized protein n=1 Tax=Hygrophoropsis aurantiaca TaxID=72124 RepID=A0ACB7ZX91_9AGAM|nr:hypothetical protein BJ138DRAFT_1164156 [Hygrophoropsis aurantiaca]